MNSPGSSAHGDNIVGLQFHLEMDEPGVSDICQACSDELVPGRWVQSAEAIQAATSTHLPPAHQLLDQLMNSLIQNIPPG